MEVKRDTSHGHIVACKEQVQFSCSNLKMALVLKFKSSKSIYCVHSFDREKIDHHICFQLVMMKNPHATKLP